MTIVTRKTEVLSEMTVGELIARHDRISKKLDDADWKAACRASGLGHEFHRPKNRDALLRQIHEIRDEIDNQYDSLDVVYNFQKRIKPLYRVHV